MKCANMARKLCICVSLITCIVYTECASAVHSHNMENLERESDGGYRARDAEHYTDSGHNAEFDHEAILGSVKQAEEFDKLSPEESKERLAQMLPLMDLNGDEFIDRAELKKWILQSFIKLSREEAEERMVEADDNHDGFVSWAEYLQDGFGAESEEEVAPDDTGDNGMVRLLQEEKVMWATADTNKDGKLDIDEFTVFINPEEHEVMHPFLLNQTLREKDKNQDGFIDLQEYLGDKSAQQDREWVVSEREKFQHELDADRDGLLDPQELRNWIIPDNDEIAEEEVEHLLELSGAEGGLSFAQMLLHHHVFVGSHHQHHHLDDEL